jgi:CRISPR-associated endonuclease/helicase Cas3
VVRDVAELASVRAQRPVLRLDPGLGQRLGITGEHLERTQAALNQVTELFRSDEQPAQAVATDLAAVVRDALTATNAFKGTAADSGIESPWRPEDVQILIDWLESEPRIVEVLAPDDPLRYQRSLDRLEDAPLVLRGARRWRLETENELLPTADESERTDEDVAGTSTASQRVTLAAHHRNVGNRARSISQALGLDETLATTVYDAARWHDLGKCDDRFQAMLHEGDRLVAEAAPEPLAKSGMPPGDVPRHRQAFIRSGLPVGARHEAWSAALVAAHCEQADYTGDFDLLLHLVASHHGRARPLLPPVTDTASGPLVAEIDGVVVTADLPKAVDWLHPSRFQRLNERYGRWGLALLEAVVRCADMTVSGEGS